MQTDHSFLPFFMQEAVYLVDEPTPVAPPADASGIVETPAIPEFSFQQKEVLVLIDEQCEDFLLPENEALLSRILQSVGLSTDDIALVNLHTMEPQAMIQALEKVPFRVVLSFGAQIEGGSSGNFFSPYVVSIDDTGKKVLLADCLEKISSDQDKKKRLWQCLQQLFPT